MVSKIKMWRSALEQGYSVTDVFNSMCTYLGEQQREIGILNDIIEDETRKKNALAKDWSDTVDELNVVKEKVSRYESALKEIAKHDNWIGDSWLDYRIKNIGITARDALNKTK
jgi:hypothetical protein